MSFAIAEVSYYRFMDSVLLKEAALKLSPFERAQLIDALWQSLDPDDQAEVDAAWVEEASDRLRAYRTGEVSALDGEIALRQLRENIFE